MNPFSTFSSAGQANTQILLQRAKSGDKSAYNDLFEGQRNRLQFYVEVKLGRKLRSQVETSDIVQETFLQAHRSFDQFQESDSAQKTDPSQKTDQSSFLGWLYRIADNRIKDISGHFNAKKRKAENAVLRGTEIVQQILDENIGPATEVAKNEERTQLLSALDDMDKDARELLMLHFLKELSYQQIAETLNIPKTTARRQIAKASIQLGAILKKSRSQS